MILDEFDTIINDRQRERACVRLLKDRYRSSCDSFVFLFVAVDYGSHPQHWLLFDRIVQQIVLQNEGNESGIAKNPDVAPIDIDVKEIVHLLAKEEELVAARKKAEELERENSDMSTRLAKKEQELDIRTQEKVNKIDLVVPGTATRRTCRSILESLFFFFFFFS